MEIIKVVDLKKSFGSVEVLRGINFCIEEGERIAIMGNSGCGKTTLLKMLGLIEDPTLGDVYYKGEKSKNLSRDEISEIRLNDIGFVFQDFRLLDSLTIQENIMLPMIINKEEEDIMLDRCNYYAEKVGIKHLLNKKPSNISGGEKQRTAICRALINNPSVIYADEPTGSLDSKTGKTIIDILVNTNIELKKTLIMVTHDPLIASHCSRVIWLKDGLLVHEIRESKKEKLYGEIIEKMKEV
ncbi:MULTISPECIES: ABC transporter ATP-binding protein [Terrisporobacter]|uniref:ABC transporter ATP-binding protein n=1 Tax=Terrisporobacter muris TaxID=2963284 RepID=A0A9X2MBZ7_9FIRM|nr:MULTISPECIES: ABC transporter ATP-binding protein [Terrisporobacter]MCC3668522.1 ABC transporter ATP-binding protein [Terrisporobacter mayombei]MCR1824737.1 ABC transporter ATP-binding protein [Terrisporobacter muris]MDU6985036.1 ABC transporter ATP-binding protein [Terrisporobacter othiniensis]MDY3371872.1 ABC transporter ATP-binding protein [Terrisporobacter othiniensis]